MEEVSTPQGQPATPVEPVSPQPQAPKGSSTMYIGLAVIILLILGGIGFYLYKHNASQPMASTHQTAQVSPIPVVKPSVTPVTAQNVDQVLQNTDNSVQQAINQANTDLNDVNKINTSQDSTNNL